MALPVQENLIQEATNSFSPRFLAEVLAQVPDLEEKVLQPVTKDAAPRHSEFMDSLLEQNGRRHSNQSGSVETVLQDLRRQGLPDGAEGIIDSYSGEGGPVQDARDSNHQDSPEDHEHSSQTSPLPASQSTFSGESKSVTLEDTQLPAAPQDIESAASSRHVEDLRHESIVDRGNREQEVSQSSASSIGAHRPAEAGSLLQSDRQAEPAAREPETLHTNSTKIDSRKDEQVCFSSTWASSDVCANDCASKLMQATSPPEP